MNEILDCLLEKVKDDPYTMEELLEISQFLAEKKCVYLSDGSYSVVFSVDTDVYIVCTKKDNGKELLISLQEKFGNTYFPVIEKVLETSCFYVYREEKLYIAKFYKGEDSAKSLFIERLERFRFWRLVDFNSVFVIQEIKDFFMLIAPHCPKNTQLDFCNGNIGWRDNSPVFFDVLLLR